MMTKITFFFSHLQLQFMEYCSVFTVFQISVALPGVWIHQPNIYTTVCSRASGGGRLRRRQSPVRSSSIEIPGSSVL